MQQRCLTSRLGFCTSHHGIPFWFVHNFWYGKLLRTLEVVWAWLAWNNWRLVSAVGINRCLIAVDKGVQVDCWGGSCRHGQRSWGGLRGSSCSHEQTSWCWWHWKHEFLVVLVGHYYYYYWIYFAHFPKRSSVAQVSENFLE